MSKPRGRPTGGASERELRHRIEVLTRVTQRGHADNEAPVFHKMRVRQLGAAWGELIALQIARALTESASRRSRRSVASRSRSQSRT